MVKTLPNGVWLICQNTSSSCYASSSIFSIGFITIVKSVEWNMQAHNATLTTWLQCNTFFQSDVKSCWNKLNTWTFFSKDSNDSDELRKFQPFKKHFLILYLSFLLIIIYSFNKFFWSLWLNILNVGMNRWNFTSNIYSLSLLLH